MEHSFNVIGGSGSQSVGQDPEVWRAVIAVRVQQVKLIQFFFYFVLVGNILGKHSVLNNFVHSATCRRATAFECAM